MVFMNAADNNLNLPDTNFQKIGVEIKSVLTDINTVF